jgi:hypothetical protein
MLVRCDDHPSKKYRHVVCPIGYPKTAVICGRLRCNKPGKVLLSEIEMKEYRSGRSVFSFNNNVVKVEVELAAQASSLLE